MKYVHLSLLVAIVAPILYIALNPENGLMYQDPRVALGLGLIGFGLCMKARKRLTVQTESATERH
jgi:hypothetical protein